MSEKKKKEELKNVDLLSSNVQSPKNDFFRNQVKSPKIEISKTYDSKESSFMKSSSEDYDSEQTSKISAGEDGKKE